MGSGFDILIVLLHVEKPKLEVRHAVIGDHTYTYATSGIELLWAGAVRKRSLYDSASASHVLGLSYT